MRGHVSTDRFRIVFVQELAVLRRAVLLVARGVEELRVEVNPHQALSLGGANVKCRRRSCRGLECSDSRRGGGVLPDWRSKQVPRRFPEPESLPGWHALPEWESWLGLQVLPEAASLPDWRVHPEQVSSPDLQVHPEWESWPDWRVHAEWKSLPDSQVHPERES